MNDELHVTAIPRDEVDIEKLVAGLLLLVEELAPERRSGGVDKSDVGDRQEPAA